MIVRSNAGGTSWVAAVIDVNANLFKIIDHTLAVRASTGVTVNSATWYDVTATIDGTTITATLDGANEISWDAAPATGTYCGLMARAGGDLFDDFQVAEALWWTVAGKTCVAAYDAIGAASLADSYTDESGSGNDAAPGVAPSWAAGTGWTFNGSTQYLTTGVTPGDAYTVIARYSGFAGASDHAVFGVRVGSKHFEYFAKTSGVSNFVRNGAYRGAASALAGATVALASHACYVDGAAITPVGGSADPAQSALYIGASNNTAAAYFAACDIQAVAIYSDTLTAGEVASLTTAMNALSFAGDPTTADLVAWGDLNETSGNRADSHGSNTLTDNNTVGYAAGKQGNAASLVRANSEFLSASDNADLSLTGDLTICAWVKLTDHYATHTIHSKASGTGSNYEWSLRCAWGAPTFFVNAGGLTGPSKPTLNDGAWHFVVCQYDWSTRTKYIDVDDSGSPATNVGTGDPPDSGADFKIGGDPWSAYWDGNVDEVCVFRAVLSSSELTWLYNAGAGRSYSELGAAAGGAVIPWAILMSGQVR